MVGTGPALGHAMPNAQGLTGTRGTSREVRSRPAATSSSLSLPDTQTWGVSSSLLLPLAQNASCRDLGS